MKKLKCPKCGLYFKDRGAADYATGTGFVRELCWNCGFIWKILGMYLTVIALDPKIKRNVTIRLQDVEITKIKK